MFDCVGPLRARAYIRSVRSTTRISSSSAVEPSRTRRTPSSASVRKPLVRADFCNFPARGTVRDQLVELTVHLQDLDDGHATPVALILALVAADGAVTGSADARRAPTRLHSPALA